ncbi:MAG: Hsp20/alpha crystallin family protein, partial [Candidatus Acetothermia bacterium]
QIERESQSKDRNYIAKGRRHGEFKRVLPLPELTKSDEIEAHFENGLLKIRAPLKEKGDEKMEIRID